MAPPNHHNESDDLLLIDSDPRPSDFTLNARTLSVNGHPFLLDVPPNVIATSASVICKGKPVDTTGCFVGFDSDEPSSRHVARIGRLMNIRFMSIFRFKVWWTTHWVGTRGGHVEHETQFIILDRSAAGRPYVLLLPLIEGSFRASLQPGENDHVAICVESGSTAVVSSLFRSSLYLHAGDDPYALMKDAMRVIRAHLGTFRLLEEKSPPEIVNKFGWCTWDAFYLKVGPLGVLEGVSGLAEGSCPPGFVIIDDGWQSICHDDDDDPINDQERMSKMYMSSRLMEFRENFKFREYKSEQGGATGMGAFVKDLKSACKSVEHVYVWHALCGYWCGLRPGVPGLPEARVVAPKLSPGIRTMMRDDAVDKIVSIGVGLVPPERAHELFEGLHSHLESVGIDGVKVDVIELMEIMGEEYGGRVKLAKAYYKALTASIRKHFNGNGVLASMEHCNDFMFLGTEAISLGRVGDDFWTTDPSGDPNWLQGCHMVHCAYNSLWIGNFIHPDWDMFQSTHPCADFHAASRAISGGPIYVSDSVGQHNFQLLKSLALPDGTILRCQHYALPTRDCLFEDPLHDGKTMLKIWNLNKFTGVLGAFNCQGGGWSPVERTNRSAAECSRPVTSVAQPSDVEWRNGKTLVPTEGVELFAVYLFRARKVVLLKPDESIEMTLEPFNYELLTLSPVKASSSERAVKFAPIGLVNMLNTGGAIQSVEFTDGPDGFAVEVGVTGAGEMKAFSSVRPVSCRINGKEAGFVYEEKAVDVQVPWSGSSSQLCVIQYLF